MGMGWEVAGSRLFSLRASLMLLILRLANVSLELLTIFHLATRYFSNSTFVVS